MINVFLGITFLIAALFPIGGYVAQFATGGLGGPIFGGVPPIYSILLILLLTYVPAALVTAIFLKLSGLKNRLPPSPPGRGLMLAGVILTILYLSARLYAGTIQGGAPGFIVMLFSPFVLWPARILLVVGVVKLLLCANPPNPPLKPTSTGKPVAAA